MNGSEIIVTRHAMARMKERLGLPKKAVKRAAQTAFDEGLRHGELRGRAKRLVSGIFLEHRTANQIRIHGEHLYLFAGSVLVTVLYVPRELKRAIADLRVKNRS